MDRILYEIMLTLALMLVFLQADSIFKYSKQTAGESTIKPSHNPSAKLPKTSLLLLSYRYMLAIS